MGNLKQLYQFKEERFQPFQHSMRVFIFGVDVSSWLTGSVSITYGDRESYNTCSLTLSNPRRLWQLTMANLNGVFGGGGEYDEGGKGKIFAHKNDLVRNPFFSLDIDTVQLGQQDTKRPSLVHSKTFDLVPTQSLYPAKPNEERRWRLAVNDCIFNKHDYIRIFVKNPLNSNKDQWMEKFCGFVQDVGVTTNYLTGESSVRIGGTCIKQQMSKMRVVSNPMAQLVNLDPSPMFNQDFFKDFARAGVGSHPFAVSSLEDTIKTLILGSSQPYDAAGGDAAAAAKDLQSGVGSFKLGNTICFNPGNAEGILERWHLMTLFGVNKVPFPQGGGKDDMWLTNREVQAIGASTFPDSKRVTGGPDSRYLHFLLPATGSGPRALVESDTTASVGSGTKEFTTRWEIIRDFASKMDFQVLTSPSGDILVEFPQYSFTPEIYTSVKPGEDIVTSNTENIGKLLVFDLHQKEDTLSDEAEDFPTVLQVSGGFAQKALAGSINEVVAGVAPRAYIYSPALAARYGVTSESADFPFIGQRQDDLKDGSMLRRLGQLGVVDYTRRLANASSWSGSLVYRPFLFPNRPIALRKSYRIGLLKTVTHQWEITKSASTEVVCHMLMAQRHDGSYRLITGAANTAIDYGGIWAPGTGKNFVAPVSGVQVKVDDNVQKQGGKGEPNATTETPKGATPRLFKDLNLLYPPFRKLIEQLLEGAQSAGLDVRLFESYRTPDRQNSLSSSVTNAEAFESYHQYGLAVDFQIFKNGKYIDRGDDPAYAKLNSLNNDLKLGLRWGGSFTKPVDPPHYQIPGSWGFEIYYKDNSRIQGKKLIEKNSHLPIAGQIKVIWSEIDARNPGLNPDSAVIPSAFDSISSSGTATTKKSDAAPVRPEGDLTSIDLAKKEQLAPAPPCELNLLTTPGLKLFTTPSSTTKAK